MIKPSDWRVLLWKEGDGGLGDRCHLSGGGGGGVGGMMGMCSTGSAGCNVVIESGIIIWGRIRCLLVFLGCALQVCPVLDSLVTNRRQFFTVHVLAGLLESTEPDEYNPFVPSPPVPF